MRPKNREDQHREDQIQITVWKDGESQKREVGQHQEDGTLGSWFKVTVSGLVPTALDYSETQQKETHNEQDKSVA